MSKAVVLDNAGQALATAGEPPSDSIPAVVGDPILAAILAAARDPQVDIAKLKELKAMYNEERDYHAQRAFNEAMQAAQAEMEPVARDRRNTQTSSNYATIEALAKAITPIYTKHGFAMSFGQGETERDTHLRITCVLKHRDGWTTDHYADVPTDTAGIKGTRNKTDTHAFGSTMSYGRRYLKLLVWDIATEDDDGNAAGNGGPIDPADADTLRELLGETGRTEAQLVAWCNGQFKLNMTTLDDLPVSRAVATRQFLASKKQAEAAANA